MKYRKTIIPIAAALLALGIALATVQLSSTRATTAPNPSATAVSPQASPPPPTAAGAAGALAIPAAPAQPSAASDERIAELSKPSGGVNGGLYKVAEGTKVDANTLKGWKTWRALACDRCHGAEQQGLVGPPLVVSLHRLTKDEFKTTLVAGRIERGMPPFSTSPMVMENLDNLYAYLKGRADDEIKPGHLYPLDAE
jgi:mono/diheme cytochrome c family protein